MKTLVPQMWTAFTGFSSTTTFSLRFKKEHTECQPFYVAVDLETNLVAFELLVRTKNRMRCSCMGYATEKQRNWLMGFADAMFDNLGIKT